MPYRSNTPEIGQLIDRGELIERFELSDHPYPFSAYNENDITVGAKERALQIHFGTAKWSKAFRMDDHRRSDMVVATEFSMGTRFPGEVAVEVRNFLIQDMQAGYRLVVSPQKRWAQVLKFAGKKAQTIASSSAVDAMAPPTSHNRIELRVSGNQLLALINDEAVALVNDRSFGFGCPLVRFDPVGTTDVDFYCHKVGIFEAL